MGNFWDNSEIKKEEVEKNIGEVNEITKSDIFMNKYKIFLKFQLEDTPVQKMSKKIIKVEVHKYDDKNSTVDKKKHSLFITIDNFYRYFNLLMNLRKLFLNERMRNNMDKLRKSQIEIYGEDESGICPICCENNVDMSLPCSHFFCEKCLKAWVRKNETCPLCRYKLTINKKNPTGVKGGLAWNIIEEVDPEEVDKENEESLRLLTKKLFL